MRIILFIVAICLTMTAIGQRKSPHDTVTNGKVTVTYGRPYKNNRDVFGGLEKYGEVWRLGADEATTITFANDVKFGGKSVKAGTYTMFAIPGEKEWTIILNSQLGQWGAFGYQKNKDKDVEKITVPVHMSENTTEQLTISFAPNGAMLIQWDKTGVAVPIT